MKVGILTLCEAAETAGLSHSLSIKNASDMLFASNAPAKVPVLCLVYRIRFDHAEEGRHQIKVSIIDMGGNFVVKPHEKEFDVKIPDGFSTWPKIGILNLTGIQFPAFGEYALNLTVDGAPLDSQTIYLLKKP